MSVGQSRQSWCGDSPYPPAHSARCPEPSRHIRRLLAGRAAEMMYYGERNGLGSETVAHPRQASLCAQRMAQDLGMAMGIVPVGLDPAPLGDGPLAVGLEAAEHIVCAQLCAAATELEVECPCWIAWTRPCGSAIA